MERIRKIHIINLPICRQKSLIDKKKLKKNQQGDDREAQESLSMHNLKMLHDMLDHPFNRS